MSMSQSSACHFVPLLARIVLGLAFIGAGFGKVFEKQMFPAADIAAVEGTAPDVDADADDSDNTSANGDSTAIRNNPGWTIQHAAYRPQDGDNGQGGPELSGGSGSGESVGQDDGALDDLGEAIEQGAEDLGSLIRGQDDPDQEGDEAAGAADTATTALGAEVEKRKLYGVAIMLHKAGWDQYNVPLAWAAALTELVGGALILVGLFARVWGLGLAITMAVAFYLTSLTGTAMPDTGGLLNDGLHFVEQNYPNHFNQLFTQLGLFVLAFGIFLTGAGAVSLDRMLFKSGNDDVDIDLTS